MPLHLSLVSLLNTIRKDEITAYSVGHGMIKYKFDSDLESELVMREDLEHESLSLEEIEALQELTKFPKDWLKKTLCEQEGSAATKKCRNQPGSSCNCKMKDLF